ESELVAHELTHVFVRQSLWRAPVWLNEGLAGFFSSIELWEKKAVLGRTFPTRAARYLGLPTLEGLLQADAHTFYDSDARHQYYPPPLLVVHMLNDDAPRDRPRFAQYVRLLRQGTPPRAAWQTAFAGVSLEGLTRRLREYCGSQHSCRSWDLPYVAAPVKIES